MKAIACGLILLAVVPVDTTAQNAPFCVVSSYGTKCFYYNASDCRRNAASAGGMCTVNPSTGQTASPPSLYESYAQGRRNALEARRQQEEIELIKAQRRALENQQIDASAEKPSGWGALVQSVEAEQGKRKVVYSCNGSTTTYPAVGCIVIGFE